MRTNRHADYRKGIKHHHSPGDVPKYEKIIMRETRQSMYDDGHWQNRSYSTITNWLHMIYSKTRAVLKRRTQQEIKEELE